MSLLLRYMRHADIRHVATIDALCFDPPWTQDSYAFELRDSSVSHMLVLERIIGELPSAQPPRPSLLARMLGKRQERPMPPAGNGTILGYGGLWQIKDEAHISTLAIDPDWRGQGYGEILLACMIGKAVELGAKFIVLEVRVGNAVAQNLYRKYGFSRVRRRKNYYRADNEDAWDMRVALDRDMRLRFGRLYAKLRLQHGFHDSYRLERRPRG